MKYEKEIRNYQELLAFCTAKNGSNMSATSERTSQRSWFGTKNFTDALSKAKNGDVSEIGKMKKSLDSLKVEGKGITFSPVFQVCGESVEVGRFLSGEPECMQEWEMTEAKGNKVVDFYFHIGGVADVTAEEKRNYGSATLAILDFLESSNVRVNLYLYTSNTFSGGGSTIYTEVIKMKSAEDALNIPILSFAMTNASMFRRLMFKVFESKNGGVGCTCDVPKEALDAERPEECVVFPNIKSIVKNFKTEETTLAWIKNKIPSVLNQMQIDTQTVHIY